MRTAFILIPLLGALPVFSQENLTLRQAIALGLRENQGLAAAAEGVKAAGTRLAQARAGRLPKVNYQESWTRSNNPVYVFGSLLTQHRFGIQNFALDSLNQPDFLNNFQSQVGVEQPLFDAFQTRNAEKSATLGKQIAGEEQRRAQMELVAGIVRAYYGAVLAGESLKAAEQAVRSAEADLRRAEAVRAAGMSTDVDVLSIRVHLAAVVEQRIQRLAGLEVAGAALNDALGVPLETPHALGSPLTRAKAAEPELEASERAAAELRPETRESRLAASLARTQLDAARGSLLPQVSIRGAFEADRQTFATRGGTNWTTAVSLRWNVFDGFANRQRIAESSHLLARSQAEERRTGSAVRLEVRRAFASLKAAEQRIEAAQASVTQAEESLRITQNRYEAGMSNVTDLLRTETALLESRTRYLAAVHDQRIAATLVELAAGRLSPDSEVLN